MPERGTVESREARRSRPWRAYEVVGLELEYSIVDAALRPQCGVERLFSVLAGHPTSDVELASVGLSNELAAHVLELKTPPERSLERAEKRIVRGIREVSNTLADRFGWRLLPTGMHPLMKPSQTRLWSRANQRIYRTYSKLFGIRNHGWLNVQSCQVNLPFGSEAEAVAMHNAAACLLAYLPALAASSPFVEGRVGRALSNRMVYYGRNQASIPILTGGVVPEYVESFRDYRERILGSIYRELDQVRGASLIRHEWVNSRGAIFRFDRQAMEVRVLDLQECPRMDVAIAAFVRCSLAALAGRILSGELVLPDRRSLLSDYRNCLVEGRSAKVTSRLLSGRRRVRNAGALLDALAEEAAQYARTGDLKYLPLVRRRLAHGNLAERMRARIARVTAPRRREAILDLYAELQGALESNEPWEG